MSKIYLVYRTDSIGYDEYNAHVVVAKSPGHARELCKEIAADEGRDTWEDASTELISKAPLNGIPRIILSDFNAG